MAEGKAVKDRMVGAVVVARGGLPDETVTVTDLVAVPPGPWAVRV